MLGVVGVQGELEWGGEDLNTFNSHMKLTKNILN